MRGMELGKLRRRQQKRPMSPLLSLPHLGLALAYLKCHRLKQKSARGGLLEISIKRRTGHLLGDPGDRPPPKDESFWIAAGSRRSQMGGKLSASPRREESPWLTPL